MSYLLNESNPGCGLYVIREMVGAGTKNGVTGPVTTLLPGMRVKFLGYEWNPLRGQDSRSLVPTWMVRFEHGGYEYLASHDLFVSEKAWADLMQFFGSEFKKNLPAADNNYTPSKWRGWIETAAIMLLISFGLWVLFGIMAAAGGK